MTRWTARYEEGYINAKGEAITISDEYHHAPRWRSPEEAMQHWKGRRDLSGPDVHEYGNGLEQIVDVQALHGFAQLGVQKLWRRVTFLLEG